MHHLKINSDIVKKAEKEEEFTVEMHASTKMIYIFVRRDSDVEILVFNFEQRKLAAKGFFLGDISNIQIKASSELREGFSILFKDLRFVEY